MTGKDLARIFGKKTADTLVAALGGNEQACFIVRLDNKTAFSCVEVAVDLPSPLRARFEKGELKWVKPVAKEKPSPFGRKSLGDVQLDEILKTVDSLHEIESVLAEPGRLGFQFLRPVPWPLFAILEFSRAFQPAAAEWARQAGTLGVRSFGLGAGVMDVELI